MTHLLYQLGNKAEFQKFQEFVSFCSKANSDSNSFSPNGWISNECYISLYTIKLKCVGKSYSLPDASV